MRFIQIILAAGALALVAVGCTEGNTSAKSDETVCVFDGSERGAQKLKYQIFPGENSRNADNDDEIVRIPTSFRFYAAFRDRGKADAGAPEFYNGFAAGNVGIQVEGQAKFRFNTENACEYWARHGRRNADDGDLGFNARSDENASALSPWVRWLNENFGTVMAATIKSESESFTWPELVYGNDPEAPSRSQEADIAYGKHIGAAFTKRLELSIGGKFFCGTNPEQWDGYAVDPECPPVFFEVGPIKPKNDALVAAREATEALRAQKVNDELEAKIQQAALRKEAENAAISARIRRNSLGAQRQDEKTRQRLLEEQVKTKRLEALNTLEVQKCLIYAKQGLDCSGRHPERIILGASTR